MSQSKDNPNDKNNEIPENDFEKAMEEEFENAQKRAGEAEQEQDSADDDAEEVTVETLQAQLEEANEKAEKNWDTVLRMKADMENQRRRNEKQVEDAHKFAVKKFVEELLPVADSLEIGMTAEGDIDKIREGMGLTMNVFKKALEKFSVEAVDPLGEKFNPDLHQAMAMQPSDEYEDGQVSAVMQKGYTLNGRIVRPAMVMVVKN